MFATMIFVFPSPTDSGAHVRDNNDIKRVMMMVIIALLPAFGFGIYNSGLQHYMSLGQSASHIDIIIKGSWLVLPILIVSYGVGGFWEMLFAVIRRHEINEGFLVTGFLIPLSVPSTFPLWQVAVATSFGVVVGKEVFGGTGMNIFNPALITRAFLFFAYPVSISGNDVWTSFGKTVVDTYTKATPLSVAAAAKDSSIIEALEKGGYSMWKMFVGTIPGSIGETSTIAILIGAIILLVTGIASWRILLSVFAGGYLMALVFNYAAPSPNHFMALPAHYHLIMGGFAFGAVFMATDPVSSSQTNAGKYIYGFLIGSLAVLVRVLNPAYPEGMMLAILFMNACAPLLDSTVVWFNIRRRKKRATE
ncbi:MAG: NADH:ubiquinone reductase (Na(+)-transporting) subunit B [Bacteroidales bacterium]|jgi:Na+-transporting NADH:ubiquinone oxidoreductase subunit B|nr:NADH:ubiquinone reductase (Na(+)-transporting) subunit B [Bacteroidales bacterium]